jgi:glucosamine--fructose-6-phosphate aminotransferase (isomerizing)
MHQLADALRPDAARRRALDALPALVDATVDATLAERTRFDPLDHASTLTVAGRRLDFATAHETALKVRELAGLVTEAFSPPDLLHGPIAALSPGAWFWLVATGARGAEILDAAQRRGVSSVVVSPDRGLCRRADVAVPLPAEPPRWVASFLAVLPGQAAGLRLAELRRVEIDRPHGLSKVTLTR